MLKGYKTYITGVMTILGALAAYLIGEAELGTTIQLVVTAVMGMTIRSGVTTEAAKKMVLGFLCFGAIFALQPRESHAMPPLAMFVGTAITGGWGAATYEECKADGLDAEDCAKRTWAEREPLDYSKLNE